MLQERNTGAWVMHFTLMETGASAIDRLDDIVEA